MRTSVRLSAKISYLVILASAVMTSSSGAFSQELEEIRGQIEDAHYAEAETHARDLMRAQEQRSGQDGLEAAEILDLLVEARRLGGWAQAPETKDLAERSLAIRRALLPPDDPALGRSLSGVARLLFSSGVYPEARKYLEEALRIARERLSPSDPQLGRVLSDMGALEQAQGNLEQAERLQREALDVRERSLGKTDPMVAKSLGYLGSVVQARGRYDEAKQIFERAVSICERTRPEHPETAWVLAGMGSLLLATGAYAEARPILERCLEIRRKTLNPDHPDLAMAYNGLGNLARRQERYDEAQRYFRLSLTIAEKRLGAEHPLTAQVLNNLAGALWQLGAPGEALPYVRRALAIREKTLPPDHPDLAQSYNSLAILLEELGSREESEAYYRRAVATYEKAVGSDNPAVAAPLWRLADLLRSEGRLDEALRLSERALAIGEKGPHRDHPDHAANLGVHGSLLREMGRCEEAIPLEERAREILIASCGPDHPEVARTESDLAILFALTGRPSEAFQTALHAEGVWREHLRLTARTLPERQALQTERIRASSLDLLLSLATPASAGEADDAEPAGFAEQAWNAVIGSRALILDQMAARHRALVNDEDAAGREAVRRYAGASAALAELLVEGAGGLPAAGGRALLDSVRLERDEAEGALSARSLELRREAERGRVGFSDVAAALPESSALVAYVHFSELDFDTCGPLRPVPSYAAFVLPASNAEGILVPLGAAGSIDSLVHAWREEAGKDPGRGDVRVREAACRAAGNALARRIWEPVRTRLGAVRLVLLVPDGSLHLANLAALPAGDSEYLVERGPALHLLSAERDLVRPGAIASSPVAARPGGFFALGDPDFDASPHHGVPHRTAPDRAGSTEHPQAGADAGHITAYRGERAPCFELAGLRWRRLKETAGEVREAAALWEKRFKVDSSATPTAGQGGLGRAITLIGDEASEGAFKSGASGHEVLHLATHGFFLRGDCAAAGEGGRGIGGYVEASPGLSGESFPADTGSVNPLRLSGLVLAGANRRTTAGPGEEDGILTAEEIGSLDLSGTSWAVLSACDTGLGEVRAGEGVLGLRRAFQVAGVRTLFVTLWPVGDAATRSWMRELYTARFVDGMDTAESVRRAGLRVLSERRRRGESTHPFYWAGFVAAGDWR